MWNPTHGERGSGPPEWLSGVHSIRSCGFGGKAQIESKLGHWIPSGIYDIRGGFCLPTSRFRSGQMMTGCIVMSCVKDGVCRLIHSFDYVLFEDLTRPLSQYQGVAHRLYTSDVPLDTHRMLREFKPKPKVFYLEPIPKEQIFDIILRNLHKERLLFEKDSDIYKNLGLFLANPEFELNQFLLSLGNLLYGIKLI
jgi:hypothetical protein